MNIVIAAGAAALDLVLPAGCPGCGSRGGKDAAGPLCPACRSALTQAAPVAFTLRAGVDGPVLPSFAAAAYDGVVRAMLLEFKEHGRLGLRRTLADCLATGVLHACDAAADAPFLIVPVPSARAARRARGHEPVAALARVAARQLRSIGVPVEARRVLRQIRVVADQSGLDVAGRQANLIGALQVCKPAAVAGRRVVVVDDIVTTGATALEAARALSAAGAVVCGVAAVAATIRRHKTSSPTSWEPTSPMPMSWEPTSPMPMSCSPQSPMPMSCSPQSPMPQSPMPRSAMPRSAK